MRGAAVFREKDPWLNDRGSFFCVSFFLNERSAGYRRGMPTELLARTAKLLEDVDDALAQLNETRAKLWDLVAQDAALNGKDDHVDQRSE